LSCYLSYSKWYLIFGDLSLKFKNLHDEILHDKVWIPTRAKMNIFRLGKLLLSCYLYFIEFGQTLLYALWEVCHTFKIKIILHISHSHFILFHQKKFSPTLGENIKNIPFRFLSNKWSKSFVLSLKYFVWKKHMAMQKKEYY
jgi:hypothetical protein